jgi:hypothetical protein
LLFWGKRKTSTEARLRLQKETSFGLAKLCQAIKDPMRKTLQATVGATDTIFFAAATMVYETRTLGWEKKKAASSLESRLGNFSKRYLRQAQGGSSFLFFGEDFARSALIIDT